MSAKTVFGKLKLHCDFHSYWETGNTDILHQYLNVSWASFPIALWVNSVKIPCNQPFILNFRIAAISEINKHKGEHTC